MTQNGLPSPLVYPLTDNECLVRLVSQVLKRPESWTRDVLFREEMNLGEYHRRDFAEQNITPFVWSERLEEYYRTTTWAITGQPAWNRRPEKLKMREWLGDHIQRNTSGKQKILLVGDGAGFDSLYLHQCGHNVTYSEVGQLNIELAQKIFELNKAKIEIVSDIRTLPDGSFDIIVCLDVLEHVENPSALVAQISKLLKEKGRLIVHAPFFFVSPLNPTHLKSNIRYSGSLNGLYQKQGLWLVDGRFFWDPIVLVKSEKSIAPPNRIWVSMLHFSGWLLAFARIWRGPHNWIAKRAMQNRSSQWLKGLEPRSHTSSEQSKR